MRLRGIIQAGEMFRCDCCRLFCVGLFFGHCIRCIWKSRYNQAFAVMLDEKTVARLIRARRRPRSPVGLGIGGDEEIGMSYNIDRWKTKELSDLEIPLNALYEIDKSLVSRGWKPDPPQVVGVEGDGARVRIEEAWGEIEGLLTPDSILKVSKISITGEGSGTFCHDILTPALKQSKGKLVAVRVWEGGDSIDRLTVIDGKVESEEIEL